MSKGIVKWFNPTKGYGFISPKDGSPDLFVHISEVEKSDLGSLSENQEVSYDEENNRGKIAAVNLKAV